MLGLQPFRYSLTPHLRRNSSFLEVDAFGLDTIMLSLHPDATGTFAKEVILEMSTLTIRLPDDKHERLRQLAKHHNMSLNKLIEELSTVALAQFDAEMRFRALAAQGSVEEALKVLDKLDKAFERR